jgi:UDP-N-acetyl-alpha-D-quinovosamine dehydrogenase
MKVLVTGGTGFVGSAILDNLQSMSCDLIATIRNPQAILPTGVSPAMIGNLEEFIDYSDILTGVDVVVHAAARVHMMKESEADPLLEYRKVNVEGTLNLAAQCLKAGVKRFIFLSSVKVNGETTKPGAAFCETDEYIPTDPYGLSKYEAEQGLMKLTRNSDMEYVIIRPVLVYGPGVKANFERMMKWISRGFPLPLGAIHNKRSLLALNNLVDFVSVCIAHPDAANQIFMLSDNRDLSTPQLLKILGNELEKPVRLIPVPEGWLVLAARLIGRSDLAQRLCGSMQVDIQKARDRLGWEPPQSPEEALKETARGLE